MILKRNLTIILLTFILLISAFFRFYNPNWDEGHYFHPDERNIAMAVSRIHFIDKLNPEFFAYGGLPIYLYRAAGELVVKYTGDPNWVLDWSLINLIGRFFSAFFSVLTIIPLYFLAKKVFNSYVGILSTLFYAFTVSSIQSAHFDTTESLLVFFATTLGLISINILENPSLRNFLIAGLVLGLVSATKTTGLSLAIFPLTAYLLLIHSINSGLILSKIEVLLIKKHQKFVKYSLSFLGTLITGLLFFTLFSPYTFLSWGKFLESMKYETGVAQGSLPVPYTLQFTNTTPYLFQLNNLIWQIGPIILLSIIGIIFLIILSLKSRNFKIIVLLSFPLLYFIYEGTWFAKFIRYIVPIIPFLIISASFLIYYIFQVLKRLIASSTSKIMKIYLKSILALWSVITIFFIFSTILWSLAFFSIYRKPQTRISSSEWIYQNIPPGSLLLGEHWDDGLPLPLGGFEPSQYNIEQLTIYDDDNKSKLYYYAEKLSSADYIIINSRRLYGTLMNLSERYPLTSRYYQLLFDGKLGYEKIAEFSSYPSIFGISINDDTSEETFQVYDHPKVLIFKNTHTLTQDDYLKIL